MNEIAVMNILKSFRGKKTILMITHRLHLNSSVDRVISLSRSGKVETGIHEDLLSDKTSLYYSLWQSFLSELNKTKPDKKPESETPIVEKLDSEEEEPSPKNL
jgi:energy-coupling factor transporter ATP-binding protein EcfA2